MDDTGRTAIERSCEWLCHEYARRADQRADSFADLFVEDGVLSLVGEEARGRDQILALIRQRAREGLLTRHVCGNICIDVLDARHATGVTDVIYFAGRPVDGVARKKILAPQAVGTYVDEYRLTDLGWRISHRKFHLAFIRAVDG